ncbi:MAG: tRNA pseudouridine(38-40) synthase TruA [Flavobacteriaceae bacterium]
MAGNHRIYYFKDSGIFVLANVENRLRYFVQFSYLGTAYHGWQKQPNAPTVQEVMEMCITNLLRKPIELVAAGRTDSGVHAHEMYAHFDIDMPLESETIISRLNSFLPGDIAVKQIIPVASDAHARFSALQRTYNYTIVKRKDPFSIQTAHYSKLAYDVELMNKAAELLIGLKDFECFSKSRTDVKTFMCDVRYARWEEKEGRLIFIISADRFLRNMVRAVVGTLLDVGLGKRSLKDVKTIIKNKDRRLAGASVPAKGLSLVRVQYPEEMLHHYG